jgi:predicted DNA-binding antitoxin AbrB/MazE fold protein
MPITVEAVYEDGVLKPKEPLPLKEHDQVRVTIDEESALRSSRVRASFGLLGWKGDAETVRQVALDPEFCIDEAP